jgi:hypothetical protein
MHAEVLELLKLVRELLGGAAKTLRRNLRRTGAISVTKIRVVLQTRREFRARSAVDALDSGRL